MRIEIDGDYIELQQLLKLAGAAESGGHAKELILSGKVQVGGTIETRRSKKIRPGDIVRVEGVANVMEVASRTEK